MSLEIAKSMFNFLMIIWIILGFSINLTKKVVFISGEFSLEIIIFYLLKLVNSEFGIF